MKNYARQIEHFDEINAEATITKKYGRDYRSDKGITQSQIDRYHPLHIKFEVADIIEETGFVKTFRLVAQDGYLPPFQAGQYINVYGEVNGVRSSRPYSMSSSPLQRAYYDISVARITGGFFSDFMLDQVKKGDILKSSGPSGNFYHNPLFHQKTSVFIAGGSGITPFMSMIREICDNARKRDITLLYGNRTTHNVLFHEELLELASRHANLNYIPVISEPEGDYDGEKGFIDAACVNRNVKNIEACTFYICGPQAMYEFCVPELENMGIPRKRLRKEMFSTSGMVTKEQGWPAELTGEEMVSVSVKGFKTISAKTGETLLTSLERAGIIIPVNCRCGECSICRIKLISGKVFQPRGVHLRAADAQFGWVHSCKCYPLEDLEILI